MKARPVDWAATSDRRLRFWSIAMSANPRQFPVVFKNVRRALLHRFPYSLFFVVEDETVLGIACFHASRDPSQWQKRI